MITISLIGQLTQEDKENLLSLAKELGVPVSSAEEMETFMLRWIEAFANDKPDAFRRICEELDFEESAFTVHRLQ